LCFIKDWASKHIKILAWHMLTTISRPLRGCSQVGPQEKGANASGAIEEAPTLIFQKLDILTEAVLSYLLLIYFILISN
jgi:hypothetical protein